MDKVVIEFKSPWCRGCKEIETRLSPLLTQHNLQLRSVDISIDKEAGKKFSIMSLPTLVFLKGGIEVNRIVGSVSISKLEEALNLFDE